MVVAIRASAASALPVLAALILPSILLSGCGGGSAGGSTVLRKQLPISDDFSGDCLWADDSSGGAVVGCRNGAYRILAKQPSVNYHQVVPTRFRSANDIIVESDATLAALPTLRDRDYVYYGVDCLASAVGEPDRGYVFVMKPDGVAGVLRFDETASELKPFYLKDLASSAPNPQFAGRGTRLRIHAECDSTGPTTRLVMKVNGQVVVSTVDDVEFGGFQAAGFDVFTTVPGTDVRYDNVELRTGSSTASDTTLPLADSFSSGCSWPIGANDHIFTYGCADGAYRMTLKKTGAVNVIQWFGLHAPAVTGEIDAAITSGRGTVPGNATLGIGCLTDDQHGYVAMTSTSGHHSEIWYLQGDGQLHLLAHGRDSTKAPFIANPHLLRIVCASTESRSTSIGFFVNNKLALATDDRHGLNEFNGFFLYANTYPGTVLFDRFAARTPSHTEIAATQGST
jgi:hypothetical protein